MSSIIHFISRHPTLFSTIFSGFGITIIGWIAVYIFHKQKEKKAVFRIVPTQEGKSYFCVRGDYTRIQIQVVIKNTGGIGENFVLTSFKLRILSPFKYSFRRKYRTTDLYDTAGTASELKLIYTGLTIYGYTQFVRKQLNFKVPTIVGRKTKNLKCKLGVSDRDKYYKASCKFTVTREEYQ